jgi:Family of unknown function (DUF6247)
MACSTQRTKVYLVTAAEQYPEPRRLSGAGLDRDGLEPAPTWVGDAIAAQRFGSPEEIRAALLPEQVAEFNAAFNAVLATARQTLRLDQLRHVLRMWRRQALMTERDPDGHRQMLATAAEVQRIGRSRSSSVPWSELKVELGL